MSIKMAWQKYRKFLLILLIIDLLFTYGLPFLVTEQIGSVKANMILSYEGSGQGSDPLGNPFDINEIKGEEVIGKALKEIKLTAKYTPQDIQKRINIQPYFTGNLLAQLQSIPVTTEKTESIKEQDSQAGQFIIEIKDKGMPSYFETKRLLHAVLKAYQEQLKKNYLQGSITFKQDTKEDFKQLDYPEMALELEQEASALIRSANRYSQFAKQFSSQEGTSFADLEVRGKLIYDQEIKNLSAMVDYHMLTRNIQERIQYEQIRLNRANLLYQEAFRKETTLSTAVGTYENNSNYLFLTNEVDALNALSQANPFYTELTTELMERKSDTIEKRYIAEQAEQRIARLQASPLTADEYAAWQKKAEAEADRLAEEIKTLRKQLNELAEENYQKNIAGKIAISNPRYVINTWGNLLLNYVVLMIIVVVLKLVCVKVERKEWQMKWAGLKTRFSGILAGQDHGQRRKEETSKQEH